MSVGRHGQEATEYSEQVSLRPGWYYIAVVWWNDCGPGVSALEVSGPAPIATTIAPGGEASASWVMLYALQPGQAVIIVAYATTPTGSTATAAESVAVG